MRRSAPPADSLPYPVATVKTISCDFAPPASSAASRASAGRFPRGGAGGDDRQPDDLEGPVEQDHVGRKRTDVDPGIERQTDLALTLWRKLWQALVDGIDRYDAIRLQKMPRQIGEHVNPLALGQHTRVADLRRWGTVADSQWAADRRTSRAFKRSQNGLAKVGACRLVFAKTEEEARRILCTLDRLQTERLRDLGRSHILSQPLHRKFYHALATSLQPDFSFLSALELDGELIACLMSVAAKPSVTSRKWARDHVRSVYR